MTTPDGSSWVSVPPAEELARLAERLAAAGPVLAALPDERLLAAWGATVEAFLDPASPERRAIEDDLVRTTALSPEGLQAGLKAVLGGVQQGPVEELFAEARALRQAGKEPADGFALVVLASNLPALAVQPLVAALAARRPVLLKSPTAEPIFAAAFVRALVERLTELSNAVAAVTWPGGAADLEAPVLARAAVVVAYGGDEALADLEARTRALRGDGGVRFVPYGPKTSLAVVGLEAEIEATAAAVARDVALFDQRGCLSVAAVYAEGPATETGSGSTRRSRTLADAVAAELRAFGRRWPPGPIGPADAAAVQQVRAEAELRGLHRADLDLRQGTVVVEPEPAFRATPGLRTVRIHPLPAPVTGDRLEQILAPWRGRLQGVALAGFGGAARAAELRRALERLGVSRIAPPGALQSPDARWHNGGVDPLRAFL